MPKFNLNWMYMIIALMLLGLYLANETVQVTKNISYDEFQQYVRNGYMSVKSSATMITQSKLILNRST